MESFTIMHFFEMIDFLTRGNIKELDGFVMRSRNNKLAVGG